MSLQLFYGHPLAFWPFCSKNHPIPCACASPHPRPFGSIEAFPVTPATPTRRNVRAVWVKRRTWPNWQRIHWHPELLAVMAFTSQTSESLGGICWKQPLTFWPLDLHKNHRGWSWDSIEQRPSGLSTFKNYIGQVYCRNNRTQKSEFICVFDEDIYNGCYRDRGIGSKTADDYDDVVHSLLLMMACCQPKSRPFVDKLVVANWNMVKSFRYYTYCFFALHHYSSNNLTLVLSPFPDNYMYVQVTTKNGFFRWGDLQKGSIAFGLQYTTNI